MPNWPRARHPHTHCCAPVGLQGPHPWPRQLLPLHAPLPPCAPASHGPRNGTPRQPLLVPLARSRLQLLGDVPAKALEGLEQYSHCWLLYVFSENTGGWVGERAGWGVGCRGMRHDAA